MHESASRRPVVLFGAVLGAALLLTGTACRSEPPVVATDSTPAPTATAAPATGTTGVVGRGTTRGTTAGTTPGTTRGVTSSTAPRRTGTTAPTTSSPPNPEYATWCSDFLATLGTLGEVESADPSDPDAFNAYLVQVKRRFQLLADSAPPAVAADWAVVNAEVQRVTTPDDLSATGDPASKAAADRIEEWSKANCGFDPSKI